MPFTLRGVSARELCPAVRTAAPLSSTVATERGGTSCGVCVCLSAGAPCLFFFFFCTNTHRGALLGLAFCADGISGSCVRACVRASSARIHLYSCALRSGAVCQRINTAGAYREYAAAPLLLLLPPPEMRARNGRTYPRVWSFHAADSHHRTGHAMRRSLPPQVLQAVPATLALKLAFTANVFVFR